MVHVQHEPQWDSPHWMTEEWTDQDPIKAQLGSRWSWYWSRTCWVLGPVEETGEGEACWERTQYGWLERGTGLLCEWNQEGPRRSAREFQLPEADPEQTTHSTGEELNYFQATSSEAEVTTVEKPCQHPLCSRLARGQCADCGGWFCSQDLNPAHHQRPGAPEDAPKCATIKLLESFHDTMLRDDHTHVERSVRDQDDGVASRWTALSMYLWAALVLCHLTFWCLAQTEEDWVARVEHNFERDERKRRLCQGKCEEKCTTQQHQCQSVLCWLERRSDLTERCADYRGALAGLVGPELGSVLSCLCTLLQWLHGISRALSWCLYEFTKQFSLPALIALPIDWVIMIRDLVIMVALDWPLLLLTELRVLCPWVSFFGVSWLSCLGYQVIKDVVQDFRATGRFMQDRRLHHQHAEKGQMVPARRTQ